MDTIIAYVSFIAITSVAAERFTEIIKKAFLSKFEPNAAVYQSISCIFGGVLCYGAPPAELPFHAPLWAVAVVTGLAVSGGSGVWNDMLTLLKNYKNKDKV